MDVGPGGIAATGADVRGEAERILVHDGMTGALTPADQTYLAELVAQESGATPTQAARRVDQLVAELGHDAEEARRAAVEASLYLALSLLMGAFIAGVAAAVGGRERDWGHPDGNYQARTSAVTSR